MSALREVQAPFHPERIPGNGPEQDYLSRLFAPCWAHISVMWNYQLHRVFHGLEAAVSYAVTGGTHEQVWVPERLSCDVDDVRIFHFSGTLKMWHRDFHLGENEADFSERLLRD